MTRMYSTVLSDEDPPAGVPGVFVYAELQGSPWLAGHMSQIETEANTYTDADGRWVLDLTSNTLLEDTESWWLVRVFQRGAIGLDVPPAPPGNALVNIAGCLHPLGPPPEHPDEYVLASRLGQAGGVATLGGDGILTEAQRPPVSDSSAEVELVREYVTGDPDGDISGLDTADKSSIVAALNEVVGNVTDAVGIDDGVTTPTSTWSSTKISAQIGTKPAIVDGAISTTTVWSSSKTDSEIDTQSAAAAAAAAAAIGQGFEESVSAPQTLVQILHGFTWKPAGITCTEADGTEMDYAAVAHPSQGVTEVTFGVPFTGTVLVS